MSKARMLLLRKGNSINLIESIAIQEIFGVDVDSLFEKHPDKEYFAFTDKTSVPFCLSDKVLWGLDPYDGSAVLSFSKLIVEQLNLDVHPVDFSRNKLKKLDSNKNTIIYI